MRDRLSLRCLWALACLVAVGPTSLAVAATSEICFNVDLRGGTTKICADVHVNPRAPRSGTTILAVHGLTETAAVWGPLTQAIFADRELRNRVRRVIALDLPGHGDSPIPVGLPGGLFGDLTIDDNVSVLIQSIRTLREVGLGALLLAPVPAGGQTFTQPPPADLSAFIVTDPALGSFLSLSPDAARFAGGFTRPNGMLADGTPDAATVAAFNGPEPLTTLLQLTDQIPALPRPSVPMGGFSLRNGTLLSVVAFSQDVLVQPSDLDDLYTFLIGGRGFLFRRVDTPTAVHSMFIVDPVGLLNELKRLPLMLQ